jgi:hypothetical protein
VVERRIRLPRALAVSALGFVAAACPDDHDDHLSSTCPMVSTQPDCDDATGCIWDPDHAECVVDCAQIGERDECRSESSCVWDGQACLYGAL